MNLDKDLLTLSEFTQIQQDKTTAPKLPDVLNGLALAGKKINKLVNSAGLLDISGKYGATNIQGEEQMKLDVYSDEILIDILKKCPVVAGVASEENDDFIAFEDEASKNGDYVVLFDPLDGSSNIDINAPIGTIFAIYKRISKKGTICTIDDFKQAGKDLTAAGYIIYGSSTMMVFATNGKINGFTLAPTLGEFCLSHPNIKCPANGKIYSLNQGNSSKFNEGMLAYLDYCMAEHLEENRPYKHRYIGSMVGDMHRTLIKGGIFIYPADKKNTNGKLRLMYECNPMSFLMETAGGAATNGQQCILDISPEKLHQRVPIFIGSKDMVTRAKSFLKTEK